MSQRDNIDFATAPIGELFRKMFFPTIIAMVSMVVLNITDGAFVGHGVGSDALAAVNIVAPIFMLSGGFGLMFGIGSNVVASIHLSHGNDKAANINLTQGVIAGTLTGLIFGILCFIFQEDVCRLLGCSPKLMPQACSYLKWICFLCPFNLFGMVSMFMVRLDGSPRVAMLINCSMAFLNILLDYILIFPLHMGLEGAAIATTTAFTLGNIPVWIYLLGYAKRIHFYPLKLSKTSLQLTLRNLAYQCKIGISGLIGEFAIAAVIIVGNRVFIHYLGEDGVAAYSVCCYCFPIVFMMGNATVQSVQPIMSFAYGIHNHERLHAALRIALRAAVTIGLCGLLMLLVGAKHITSAFLDSDCHAYQLCVEGMPYFSLAFLFIAINIVMIGFFQSVEQANRATLFTLFRGFILPIPTFIILPYLIEVPGLWLALPLAEGATMLIIFADYYKLHSEKNTFLS